jgi:hypothetical protein
MLGISLGVQQPEYLLYQVPCEAESLAESEGLLRRESTREDRATCRKTWRGDEVGSDIEEVASEYTDVPFPAEGSHGCQQIRSQWV